MLSPSFCPAAGPPFEFAKIQINDRLAAMGEPRMQSMSIAAVAFSPDSSRLAVEFRDVESKYVLKVHPTPPRVYVMVVPTANSSDPGFLINPQKLSFPGTPPVTSLWWSPDGKSLVYANVLIHLPGGETCRLPSRPYPERMAGIGSGLIFQAGGAFGGFIGPNTSIVTLPVDRLDGFGIPRDTPSTFGMVDSDCRLTSQWSADRPLSVDAVSPDGRKIALVELVRNKHFENSANIMIVPPNPKTPVDRINFSNVPKIHTGDPTGDNAVFVDSAVCLAGRSPVAFSGTYSREQQQELQARNVAIQCWDTATGKPTRHSPQRWLYSISPLTVGDGKIAIGDNGQDSRMTGGLAFPPRHAIWDFRTGKILAEWSPETDEGPGAGWGTPLGFAISPDGKLVAEGRSDYVLLYKLP